MSKLKNAKIVNFYGNNVARPYVVLKDNGEVDKERVDPPKINDALIEWAQKVPFGHGGALVKPVKPADAPKDLPEARTDFQIFLMERYTDILAANPGLDPSDRKTLLAVASLFWREGLSAEERKEYRERSKEERERAAAAVAEAEEANPRFKTFRQQLQKYKRSVGGILRAAKEQAGPLWKLQKRVNKYKAMEEGEEEEEEVEAKPSGKKGTGAGSSKKQAKAGQRGGKKQQQQQDEDEDEEMQEVEGERQSEGEEAAEAIAVLSLKSMAKKGAGKKAAVSKPLSAKKKPLKVSKAASKGASKQERTGLLDQEGDSEGEEEQQQRQEQQRPAPQQQQRQGRGRPQQQFASPAATGRNRAAEVARRNTRRSGGQLYDGEYDLPPSQAPSPSGKTGAGKARGGKKSAAKEAAPAAAAAAAPAVASLPSKSPGKRGRGRGRAAGAAGAAAPERDADILVSPAKKLRSSSRK